MPAVPPLRLGTRGSPLALAQARLVAARLAAADPALAEPGAVALVPITTTGDRVQDRRLSEIGNKGLFIKEIEEALADRRIDAAVHSMKDVETRIAPQFAIGAVLPREDPRDVFLSLRAGALDALPAGAVVGTSSLRRQAQVLRRRPDLRVANFRGNVETRLRKLAEGAADATLLALAGLRRLGLADRATAVIEPEEMLPAVAQGAIGIECRSDDTAMRDRLAAIDDPDSAAAIGAERELLAALDGSCRTPIGALATVAGGTLALRAILLRPDGSRAWETARAGPAADAAALGRDAGAELRARGDEDLFR